MRDVNSYSCRADRQLALNLGDVDKRLYVLERRPIGGAGTGEPGPPGPEGPPGPIGPEGPAGEDGTPILSGTTPPADSLGNDGEFYADTAAGQLYGPKQTVSLAADEWPTATGAPNSHQSTGEFGLRFRFGAVGRIVRLRYQRLATTAGTVTLRVWDDATQIKLAEVTDTQSAAGYFEVSLPTPIYVANPGTTLSFTFAGTGANAIPVSGSPPTWTNTTNVTYVTFANDFTTGHYPGGVTSIVAWVVPVFKAGTVWPLTVRLDRDLIDIAQIVPANDDVMQRKGNVWTNRTPAQLKTDLAIGTGDVSGLATNYAPIRRTLNAQTGTTYTPVVGDENKMVTLSNAATITVTLPQNSAAAFPIGAEIEFLWLGVGQPIFAAGTGATLNGQPGLKIVARYGVAKAKKVATNDWIVYGDLAA